MNYNRPDGQKSLSFVILFLGRKRAQNFVYFTPILGY